ncbi:MAG TPA: hypothetical protein VM029_22295 [Opitutaceae bacterium]|nr:hypothetical protein [Opitutaceae bacterium]
MTAPVISRCCVARPCARTRVLLSQLVWVLCVATLTAQQVRPPGTPGTPVNPGNPLNPVNPVNPVNPPVATGPRIVTDAAILVGESVQAGANLGGGNQAGATVTYQWTISGGRITTDSTRQTIQYVADAAGTVMLNVAITNNGNLQSATAQVTAISAATAGLMSAPPTVVTNATGLTATVPPAQDADRTFRWSLTGGGGITSGQGTNSVTFRAAGPGLLEVSCDVTLQRLVTITLRAFVVVSGDGPPASLTVNGGSGGGTFPAGSRVDLFANPPAAGQVFDKWTGDTTVLGAGALAASVSHAIVTVPAAGATLTATYKPAPAWTPTMVANFNPITQTGANNTTTTISTTLGYHIPTGAQGIVFLLHDVGGNLNSWFNAPEQVMLARDLVAAGYGVAALNSVNRNNGSWAAQGTLANNPDAANIAAALDKFSRDGVLAATRPVFLLGFAGGADAAARFAEMLATSAPGRPIQGTVLYCATGGPTLAVTSEVPQFFALADNDEALGAAGNTDARENSQLLAGRGVPTASITNNASPVHPGRFRALGVNTPTFTSTDAQAIWNAVKEAGFIDANNFYLKSLPSLAAVRTALPAAYQARAAEVLAQLGVAYGAQEFFSDSNARVIAFLNARVARTPAPQPGRMVNLSTRTKIAFVGDSFALGFNISGTARATLLIRGIGPALARFGLPTALTAPRLEINRGAELIASNEGWNKGTNGPQIAAAAAAVGAFALADADADAAVLLTLDPGSYTATVRGLNGSSGDVLAEVYDVSKNATRLTNLSTLAKVDEEGGLVTPGIVIQGTNPRTIVARAVAPGLTDLGIPTSAVLGDPRITILNNAGGTVATNNNWSQNAANGGQGQTLTAVFPAVGAFALRATNSDAAVVTALAPGNFTLQAGAAPVPANLPVNTIAPNQTGLVLVEVYEVP